LEEEEDTSGAGAGVGGVSTAAEGKKLDDVAATTLSDAPHGSSAAADASSQVPANVDVGGVVPGNDAPQNANAGLVRQVAVMQ
jgi:hypothetical protein